MSVKTLNDRIVETPGICGGVPRIAGRRIRVQDIVWWHLHWGRSVDEIASEFDLERSDIHAALAYYYDNREKIDRIMAEADAFVAEMMAKAPPSLLKQRRDEHDSLLRG